MLNLPLITARIRLNLARLEYRDAKAALGRTNKWAAVLPPFWAPWVRRERSASMTRLNKARAALTREILNTEMVLLND